MILEKMSERNFENIHFRFDEKTGLRSIIAIHSTKGGPALGGCRFYPYPDEATGLNDVMNLAHAMSYKAALAGLPLGGGKSIIFGDAKTSKTQEKLEAFAEFVESLGGRYITSVDSGTSPEDLNVFLTKTKHVTGMTVDHGGSGDPSPTTALGTFVGIQAAAEIAFGSSDISGKTITIQGVGNVGKILGKHLIEAGAKLIIADYDAAKAAEFKDQFPEVAVVDHTKIVATPADIFAPCAMGGVINTDTINTLQCEVVAGAANNPLASMDIANALHAKGIVYAPDFAINAGGLIHVADELEGFDPARVEKNTRRIFDTIKNILTRANNENVSPAKIARDMAREAIPA
ncbi:MAG: Glu/Leu/Phe/Val dehydrogenase [Deltaproteobacteria bacterium]|nr:Glu/Leu/Phe/Val dehydrogenase [Deltaproteobacteria bacterium]